MEMQQIRYFLALSETLNFTRAAERCHVSQPALTRAIQALEDELGGPLFHRERANTHLTELGRMMLPYFTQVRGGIDAAKTTAKSYQRLENVALSIGAMCTISPTVISSFLCSFRALYPSIELDVRDLPSNPLCEDLAQGRVELALYGYPEIGDDRFHYLPLYQERFVIVVPPNNPLAQRNVVQGCDLDGQPYVCRKNCEVYNYVEELFIARGIALNEVFRSERDDWVLGMVRAGLGIGFFPEFSVPAGDLVVRPLIDPEFVRTIYLLTVRGRPHSPAVGAFVHRAKANAWPDHAPVRH